MALNVFFWMARPSERGRELLAAAASVVAGGRFEVFSSPADFQARMHGPKPPPSLAIVWDPTRDDLRALDAMQDLLAGLRILLVLPDDGAETIALAHRLRPAYVSYVDDGISEVVDVLGRLTVPGEDVPRPGST